MSETAACRQLLSPYCTPLCLDIGFGGSAITPEAITLDLAKPYCPSLEGHRQILQGDAAYLPFICDGAFMSVYSSHLIEDYTYREMAGVLREWRRILRVGGHLVINAPDQQKFLAHCAKTGQGLNLNHKEADFCMETFIKVLDAVGAWQPLMSCDNFGAYSWLMVVKKI